MTNPLNTKTRVSYDAAGDVVQRIDANGKYTNYTLYDALNRIRTVATSSGLGLMSMFTRTGSMPT